MVLATAAASAQDSNTTRRAETPVAVTTPAEGSSTSPLVQDTPAVSMATAGTEVQRTVVSTPTDTGKWGLLGLLGLLGLAGLRRREGEVTVVDRTAPRPPIPQTDSNRPIGR